MGARTAQLIDSFKCHAKHPRRSFNRNAWFEYWLSRYLHSLFCISSGNAKDVLLFCFVFSYSKQNMRKDTQKKKGRFRWWNMFVKQLDRFIYNHHFLLTLNSTKKKKKERKRTTFFFVKLRHVKTKNKKELSQVVMNAQKNVVFQDRSTFHAIARFYF